MTNLIQSFLWFHVDPGVLIRGLSGNVVMSCFFLILQGLFPDDEEDDDECVLSSAQINQNQKKYSGKKVRRAGAQVPILAVKLM